MHHNKIEEASFLLEVLCLHPRPSYKIFSLHALGPKNTVKHTP